MLLRQHSSSTASTQQHSTALAAAPSPELSDVSWRNFPSRLTMLLLQHTAQQHTAQQHSSTAAQQHSTASAGHSGRLPGSDVSPRTHARASFGATTSTRASSSVPYRDLREGYGRILLPYALWREDPNRARAWNWQYVFPRLGERGIRIRVRSGVRPAASAARMIFREPPKGLSYSSTASCASSVIGRESFSSR